MKYFIKSFKNFKGSTVALYCSIKSKLISLAFLSPSSAGYNLSLTPAQCGFFPLVRIPHCPPSILYCHYQIIYVSKTLFILSSSSFLLSMMQTLHFLGEKKEIKHFPLYEAFLSLSQDTRISQSCEIVPGPVNSVCHTFLVFSVRGSLVS